MRTVKHATSRTVRALGTALLAFAAVASAHHSGAMFDREKEITITGTVTEFTWTNPHASFRVDVPNAEGKVESWAIEMNSPNNLVHAGWKRSTIKAGDKVTVKIHPLRDGRPGGLYVGITLPDGRYLGAPVEKNGY
ncbi:MAG TPA: DUF6152 family protein [Steroidobacteraceae bacterium]|nr:DUF6152 family protein [Steroidobacteraceae bacterium]